MPELYGVIHRIPCPVLASGSQDRRSPHPAAAEPEEAAGRTSSVWEKALESLLLQGTSVTPGVNG